MNHNSSRVANQITMRVTWEHLLANITTNFFRKIFQNFCRFSNYGDSISHVMLPREEIFRLIEDQKIKSEINGEEREFFEIRSYLDNGGYGQVSLYMY